VESLAVEAGVEAAGALEVDAHGTLPYIRTMAISSRRNARSGRAAKPRDLKKERLELRVSVPAKELILRAAEVSGLTAGDLAYEGARRVLDEHERMVLTGADRDVFLAALANPPAPAKRLIAALKRHRDLVG
jgi:uncharacterized protein (DUF1778 family)